MTDPEPNPMTDPEPSAEDTSRPPPTAAHDDPLRGSRTSGLWAGVVVASVLMVLLIIFIAQNTRDVEVSFLVWDGTTSLAVMLLIATVAGVIITAVAGTLRIWQLRRRVKRERKTA